MTHRSRSSGFTLLEAMLAMAILGMVLAGIFTVTSRSLSQLGLATRELNDSEMARALLDEYLGTYPEMPASGTYQGAWSWQVREEQTIGLQPSQMDESISFIRVTVTVERLNSRLATPLSLTATTARRPES
ncbi:type II secretion system protein [Parasedimentitalea huanghaiensis]|uniref:type II secretion system protein n=1 Tax=Parasedimentitalea huanghaiensis TaxID=2682100 RepID=UPI003CC90EA0